MSHGLAVSVALLCFVRANYKMCHKKFSDLAYALNGSNDLELSLTKLYQDIGMATRFRDLGIRHSDLNKIAFEASMDVPNMVGNPLPPTETQILELLNAFY